MTMFQTDADWLRQREVADMVEAKLGIILHSYGRKNDIDWWAEKDGEVAGVWELKCRTNTAAKYPTVYLGLRKWVTLKWAAFATGKPSIFVVGFRFADGDGDPHDVRYIDVENVPTGKTTIIGRRDHRAKNDREPGIEVPIGAMYVL